MEPRESDPMPDGALRIDGELTIYTAEAVRERLLGALQDQPAVEIDLAGVTEFDTAGLQVLMAARSQALKAGAELRLQGASPAVRDLLDLYDLNRWFLDPPAWPGDTGRIRPRADKQGGPSWT
jgi:anti-anti-sigma factor